MKKGSRSKSQAKSNQSQSASKKQQPKRQGRSKKEESESEQSSESKSNSPIGRRNQSPSQNQVAFAKSTYVAFIDPRDSLEHFKIAYLLEPLKNNDDEVLVDIYSEIAPFTFRRDSVKQVVSFQWIITDVATTADKSSTKQKPAIKITKQLQNKVTKLMEATVKNIQDEDQSDFEDEEEESSEEESSQEVESEESEEEEESLKKDSAEDIQKRKIFKAKKRVTSKKEEESPIVQKKQSLSKSNSRARPQTQPVKRVTRGQQVQKEEEKKASKGKKQNQEEENKPQKGQKSISKDKRASKTPLKSRKKQDQEMKDDDSNEEEDKVESNESSEMIQIDTASKKKGGAKKKIISKTPQVGQKRLRAQVKITKESEDEDMENSDEDIMVGSKKRRGAGGKEEKVSKQKKPKEKKPKEKKPKQQKKPTEFKKGKWNPDIELVDIDIYREGEQTKPFFDCCVRCNNKNVIRAVIANNEELLKNCMAQKKKISSLVSFWSPEIQMTSLDYIVQKNNHDMLEILLHPDLQVPAYSTYEQQRQLYYNDRVHNPPYLMNIVDTGMVSQMAYGAKVRKVQMTRGNREGNNAFMTNHDNNFDPFSYVTQDKFLNKFFYSRTFDWESFETLYKLNPNIEASINNSIYQLVRAGNLEIAYEVVKRIVKYSNWGFNVLHEQVLNPKVKPLEKFVKASITKKANTNKDLTPLHCACINPNVKYLTELLDAGGDINVTDVELLKPIHYAVACENAQNLQLLLDKGANINDLDNQKRNCLHYACLAGRPDSVRLILQTNPILMKGKDKKGMLPIAYALKYGHLEALKVLLEFKARVNSGYGLTRATPLIWAATYGHLDMVEYLLDNKGRVLGKDKFKRTALIMAVRNGFTRIASLLLQRGSEWNHQDSSMNTPLHYAAAYGHLDCMDLLFKAGADVNSANSWKITPINIAMLKNHRGAVKKLLDQPNVDVNCKDEKGRTLLMLSLVSMDDETKDFVKYLLAKGAEPNMQDLEGKAALHYVAKYNPSNNQLGQMDKAQYEKNVQIQKEVAQLIIDKGGDLSLKDNSEKTPFAICLDLDNAPILEFLKEKVSFNREPTLFFQFASKIFNIEYQKILLSIMKNDSPSKENINCLDIEGFTPFLKFIKLFTQQAPTYYNLIGQKLDYQKHHMLYRHEKQFKLKNEDLFEKFPNNQYVPYINDPDYYIMRAKIVDKLFIEIIINPFKEILQKLIDYGAEPHAQIQKLKRYRDQEALMQQNIALMQNNQKQKIVVEEEKVKRRDEKLMERSKRGRGKMARRSNKAAAAANSLANIFYDPNAQQAQNQNGAYDNRNGEKVEREYGQEGLRNAFHILLSHSHPVMFEYLTNLQINPDEQDYDENTPFTLLSQLSRNDSYGLNHMNLLSRFEKLNVRLDCPNIKGRTPFLNYYEKSYFDIAYDLLTKGANVNQIDTTGNFAMKMALIRRSNAELQKLIDHGGNVNQIDNKGRNLLHHAVNMSSASADATFETEQFLIDNGIELNLTDHRGRTPLHYAFVKIQNWSSKQQIDPIETVSSLCGCKGLEMDVPDKWLKTPLHYASQRGASVCAVYLINRQADTTKLDIYGNTCLGVGLMSGHFNYCIILIEKQLDVNKLIFPEDPERINKMWAEEEKAKSSKQKEEKKEVDDDEMDIDEEGGESKKKRKKAKRNHRNMFGKTQNLVNDYYDEEDDDYGDEYDEEDYDSDDYGQEQMFNQQNPFNQKVYAARPARRAYPFANYGGLYGGQMQQQPAQQQNNAQSVQKDEKQGASMFKLAIRGGQQGLAYLILDKYDMMLAMQDAMDEKKFMLVLTLLSKNPNDEIIQKSNNKGQNLFHILAMNAGSCQEEHLIRIYKALLKRGVDCKAKDINQRTALHYAVISNSYYLVKELSQDKDYDVNGVDVFGHTPFTLCIEGARINQTFQDRAVIFQNSIFGALCAAGADVNVLYPEKSYQPAFKAEEIEDQDYKTDKDSYKCTPIIHLIRSYKRGKLDDTLRNNIGVFIKEKAKFDNVDTDGRDLVIYSTISNNTELVKFLLSIQGQQLNKQIQDKLGKSVAHYVVNPIKYGSYENTFILKALYQANYPLNLKDNQNKTPLQYAQEYESQVLFNELTHYLKLSKNQIAMFSRMQSMIMNKNWPVCKVDYENDSELFMEEAKKKEEQDYRNKKNKVPVDPTGFFEVSYEVYYQNEKPWDIYLTKVDLKNGIYGDYVFYKMQLLYDKNRDLFVVFTRWGRIGETGMNQRTPFGTFEEAKTDFCKIFKQKTGGNDFEDLDSFVKHPKKYNINKVNYVTVDFKDYLSPFDFDKLPKSKLHKKVYDLFEEISNVTMYQRAMSNFGVDINTLPFSNIKKETLVEARQILSIIKEAVDEDIEISKLGIKADYEKLTAVKEKIAEYSSRFYELIPMTQYKNQIAPPLSNHRSIQTQYENLENLTYIEHASKMLLGALYKQQEQNPIDYVYDAINMMIEPLKKDSPEFEVINTYIKNTNENNYNLGYHIENIFKIQRKGEAESIQAYKNVPNHFLLFHGSMLFNFVGILSQGLRIAPPEAPPTGYMFGKGVYFADMFSKSAQYSARGYNQQDSYLMMMCEVALGKSKELYEAQFVEKLEPQYHSVKGMGRRAPDYDHTITLPNGVKIPYGPVVDTEIDKNRLSYLQHNEFIVYNTSQVRMRYLVQMKK